MIQEYITDELIAKINAELKIKHSNLQTCIGQTLKKSQIEEEMLCDIYINYYQTPLCEVDDIIKKVAPFLDELEVTLLPYIGDIKWSYNMDCDATVKMYLCSIDVEGWNKLDDEQKEQVNELREELFSLYYELNFDMTLGLSEIEEDEELDEDLDKDWNEERDPEYQIVWA